MIRTATAEIDIARYERVTAKAIKDLSLVLTDRTRSINGTVPGAVDGAYSEYFNVKTNKYPLQTAGQHARKLVRDIGTKLGYEVHLYPYSKGERHQGYPSWLYVQANNASRELIVRYVKGPKPCPRNKKGAKCPGRRMSPVCTDKKLSRSILHECGHASLHVDALLARRNAGNPDIMLDPDHEQDAWVYAMTICGILVGDHARFLRTMNKPDTAGSAL